MCSTHSTDQPYPLVVQHFPVSFFRGTSLEMGTGVEALKMGHACAPQQRKQCTHDAAKESRG